MLSSSVLEPVPVLFFFYCCFHSVNICASLRTVLLPLLERISDWGNAVGESKNSLNMRLCFWWLLWGQDMKDSPSSFFPFYSFLVYGKRCCYFKNAPVYWFFSQAWYQMSSNTCFSWINVNELRHRDIPCMCRGQSAYSQCAHCVSCCHWKCHERAFMIMHYEPLPPRQTMQSQREKAALIIGCYPEGYQLSTNHAMSCIGAIVNEAIPFAPFWRAFICVK